MLCQKPLLLQKNMHNTLAMFSHKTVNQYIWKITSELIISIELLESGNFWSEKLPGCPVQKDTVTTSSLQYSTINKIIAVKNAYIFFHLLYPKQSERKT